jgi:hypothetical protein
MANLEVDEELYKALRTLALGASIEEMGRDSEGNTKIFKRKLPPNFEAIKYIYENKKPKRISIAYGEGIINGNS